MKNKTKKKSSNTREIVWNVVNSCLAGLISFLSALVVTNGEINLKIIYVAGITSGLVLVTQFYNFWKKEEGEYSTKLFNFVGA